ncbi:MAG: DnaJ domain-containing protein [Phormidesmis sp. CAN_BIN36]|nr:DnaJ domain-containing protein [Phormidesmis sp. CAN_BIN36]
MNIADCYRLLGLRTGASYEDVKASYRRLARQFHPDVNPNDRQANEKFIQVTEAYRLLLGVVSPSEIKDAPQVSPDRVQPEAAKPKITVTRKEPSRTENRAKPKVTVTRKEDPKKASSVKPDSNLSFIDQQLKQASYEQLQQLLREKRFPRAIALVEGLAQRLPIDPEIRQWQAITYQSWGRQLIQEKQFEKARLYLKKALRTDPHNRSLWGEVERDFRRLEQVIHQRK